MPSDDEWKELEMYLGMSQADADSEGWRGTDEGGKLKETGTTHWDIPNTIQELITKVVSQPFLVAAVATMDHSPALENTVVGGVLQSTIQTMLGAGTCTTMTTMFAGTNSIRRLDTQFDASKTNRLFIDNINKRIANTHYKIMQLNQEMKILEIQQFVQKF